MSKPMELRPATAADADRLLAWRNDPVTRSASHSPPAVTTEEHGAWLERTLGDPARRLLIAELAGEPVGVVRADLDGGIWELSWTVAPEARGRGVAKQMVALAAAAIQAPLRAEVKAGNSASVRVAEHAGLAFEREEDGVLHFRRNGPAA